MPKFIKTISTLQQMKKRLIFYCLFILLLSGNVVAQTPISVVIGNTAGTGNWFYGPIYRNTGNTGTLNYSRYGYIYTAAELANAGIPSGVRIVKLEWLKKDGGSIAANNSFNVWMSNTTTSTFPTTASWGSLEPGTTQVFSSSTFSIQTGNNTYTPAPFNVPGNDSFTYGGSNLMILTDWAKTGFQTGSGINFYVSTGSGKAIGIASNVPMSASTILQAATYGNSRPTVRITYVPVPPCAGIPTTGPAVASVTSACSGIPFSLSIQNTIPGTGVSYIWQKASNPNFTLNLATIGNSSTLNITETTATYYRCIASCLASGLADTSTPIFIPLSAHYECYCSSSALSPADEEILNYTFGSLSNSSNCSTLAGGVNSAAQMYSNYQYITPPNVEKESTVPFSIQVGTCLNTYPNRSVIFIDYNFNGTYETNELVYATPNAISGAHTESGSIIIPASALSGITGMRVITSEQGPQITNPCLQYSWGETEDYLINITPTTICNGLPSPGNTIANSNSVCSGKTAILSLQNLTTGLGVTYQWYKNSTLIPGATSYGYTSTAITSPTSFYCAVTCSNSSLTANSNPITITLNNFKDCYCLSQAAVDVDEDIFDFTFNGTTINTDCITTAPGPGSILGRYSNFHPLGSIDTVLLGQNVPFVMHSDDCDQSPYYSFGTAIWIDFNQNGSFNDPGELVFIEPVPIEGPRYIFDNVKIPCTALEGQTGMRISIIDGLAGTQLTPCLAYGYGETEDYLIYIIQADTCGFTTTNKAGNTQATITHFCDSTTTLLSMQNKCFFNNYTYQWYRNDLLIVGATNSTYSTPMIYNSTSYNCIVTCNNGVVTHDTSAPITILKSIPTVNLVGTSNSYCLGGTPVTMVATGAINYTYDPVVGLNSSIGQIVSATPGATTIYTVTGVNVYGCSNTASFTIGYTTLPVNLLASSNLYCYPTGNPVQLSTISSGAININYTPSAGLSINTGNVVFATPSVTTTYIVTASDSTGCSGIDSVTITSGPCVSTLNVKLFIEGYYEALGYMKPVLFNQGESTNLLVVDSIDVELHDSISPYGLVHAKRVLLHTDGTAIVDFPALTGSYYVAIKHRNALQTWSANPINVSLGSYDFSSDITKAYGNNMIQKDPGIWALFSGDLNSDSNADLIDQSILEADVDAFAFGYQISDLNGDGNVDLIDAPILEINAVNFVFSIQP